MHGDHLRARRGSGLEKLDGGEEANHGQGTLGVRHRFSPALEADASVHGETFNIGAEQESDVLQITAAILDHLGKPKSLIRHVEDRPAGRDRGIPDLHPVELDHARHRRTGRARSSTTTARSTPRVGA